MRVAVFSAKSYDRKFLDAANQQHQHELLYLDARLEPATAAFAGGSRAVCAFVNDDLSATVLDRLAAEGVEFIALRSAGFSHVDLEAAERLGLKVAHVPSYSPEAIAEHTMGLILTLNRHIHRAYNRAREGNFSLEGMLGFDLHGKTVGLIGTGKIGTCVARILHGFGCRMVAYDVHQNPECRDLGVEYVDLAELFARSDIVTLHCPLTPETHHLIDTQAISQMRPGVMLINTSRGAVVDTQAVIEGLKAGNIGYLGLDVYEEETELFFRDHAFTPISDDLFARLLTFPNVIITGHMGFFTREAVGNIAGTTLSNITSFEKGAGTVHLVSPKPAN